MATIDRNATQTLIMFVRNYTDLMEKNLHAIQTTMRETVDGVMTGINEISDKTSEKKRIANEILVTTYVTPDAEATKAMDSVQNDVNRILEMAEKGALGVSSVAAPKVAAVDDNLRRSAGLFSKHMEALETLDTDLQGMLLKMMGALSRDDVISQRISHVVMAMNALQTSLTYILTDIEVRCKEQEVERFTRDLKDFVFKIYTMEEEKQAFYNVFPDARKKKKAG